MSMDFYSLNGDIVLNMANGNASLVTKTLGIELDWEYSCGHLNAQDVLERCMVALSTDQAFSTPTVREGNFILCGSDEEYMNRKFADLAEVAREAISNGQENISYA